MSQERSSSDNKNQWVSGTTAISVRHRSYTGARPASLKFSDTTGDHWNNRIVVPKWASAKWVLPGREAFTGPFANFPDCSRTTCHPEVTLGSLCEFETYPDWGANFENTTAMDTAKRFVPTSVQTGFILDSGIGMSGED
jgi:hypothetical protein